MSAALLLGALGCSAPVCRETSDRSLTSAQFEDSLRATRAGEENAWHLRATLRNLPKLWSDEGAITDAFLAVQISVAYDGDPPGGDGKTEMPNVRVTFDGQRADRFQVAQTPTFAGPAPARFSVPLFDTCNVDGQENCCRFGAQECSVSSTLRLERVQGEPFPPILVDFSAQALASVNACPIPGAAPALSLEQEAE